MPAKPIFVGGTGSHAGKSWVSTAICRYLYRMGHRVAPFKAQNMSNNSMVCVNGGEIGLLANGPSGPDYTLLISTNLTDWQPVLTVPSPTPPVSFVDTNYAKGPVRFYRVELGP